MAPEAALRAIRHAAVAGLVSGSMTAVVVLFSVLVTPVLNQTWVGLVDAALIFGLTWGVHRRSRVAAVLLLGHFLYAKAAMFFVDPVVAAGGLVMGLVFAHFYLQGLRGTFACHRARMATRPHPDLQTRSRRIRVGFGLAFASPFLLLGSVGLAGELSKLRTAAPAGALFGLFLISGLLLYAGFLVAASWRAGQFCGRTWGRRGQLLLGLSALGLLVGLGPPLAYQATLGPGWLEGPGFWSHLGFILFRLSLPFGFVAANLALMLSLVVWRLRRLEVP